MSDIEMRLIKNWKELATVEESETHKLEIEDHRQRQKRNKKTLKLLRLKFYAIGQPLNDNSLKFNKEQLKWCFGVLELTEQL